MTRNKTVVSDKYMSFKTNCDWWYYMLLKGPLQIVSGVVSIVSFGHLTLLDIERSLVVWYLKKNSK